jgi:UDP-2,3-diacylglucosamine pyrophosphatase LpxH
MMRGKRLQEVFEASPVISFDNRSRFILFSDCHRGDNSWADDFAHNENVFQHAMSRYYAEDYTYIELGDGDELWENNRFEDIRRAHSSVFKLLRRFYREKRFFLLYGNHDKERRSHSRVERTLYRYFDARIGRYVPLFEGIEVHEGLVLEYRETGARIFLVHGHQGDLLNDRLWWLAGFLNRFLWRQLQLIGVRDPTRPAVNAMRRKKVERKLTRWVQGKGCIVVAGHTHRPRFPGPGAPPSFNTGSCVHPRSITGIEIEEGSLQLVKWFVGTREDGLLQVSREVLAGPAEVDLFCHPME